MSFYSVSLDDRDITDVSDFVRIVDVIELQPNRTTTTHERLGAPGSFLTRDHINNRQVRVQFALLTSDFAKRTKALSDITAWAMAGKFLKISDRPGQQLRVVCTDTPLTMSKRKWTELCEMTFTAFSVPFWEDVQAKAMKTYGVTSASLTLQPPGNVRQVPLRCTITPTTRTLTALTIAANGAEMVFSGLAVPAGKTLVIDYEEGLLITKWLSDNGTEVPCLRYRTGAEYIPLSTGTPNVVSISADTAVNAEISAKGWYW